MNKKLSSLTILLVGALVANYAWASIEKDPVKVTHRNSGPRYDIDDVERTRLGPENNPESNQIGSSESQPQEGSQETPVFSIRRIFLVPLAPSIKSEEPASSERVQDSAPMWAAPRVSRPESSWHPMIHHLFGSDDASRSPKAEPSYERPLFSRASAGEHEEASGERATDPTFLDPFAMFLDSIRQVLNQQMFEAQQPTSPVDKDLNKEASGDKPTGGAGSTGLERPSKQGSFNETKEDIIEIEGKKYLRKTVINRHVGDGIMFMTRRLIFSPLNETDTEAPSSTQNPPSTTVESVESSSSSSSSSSSTTAGPTSASQEPISTEQPSPPRGDDASTIAGSNTESPVTTSKSEAPSVSESSTTSTTTPATDREDTTKATNSVDSRAVNTMLEKMVMGEQPTTASKPTQSS